MTNEEVIALAQEAGLLGKWEGCHKVYTTFSIDVEPKLIEAQLAEFARLVRNAALEEAAEKLEVGVFLGGAKVIRAMKEETK